MEKTLHQQDLQDRKMQVLLPFIILLLVINNGLIVNFAYCFSNTNITIPVSYTVKPLSIIGCHKHNGDGGTFIAVYGPSTNKSIHHFGCGRDPGPVGMYYISIGY